MKYSLVLEGEKGTRNAIFVLRMIMERAIEKQKHLYMCFVDFEKAFDRVRHELLIDRLRRIEADVKLLTNLYWEQKVVVKIGDDRSDWIKIEKGVRQGCVLSPDLYSQLVMDEMEQLDGIKIGGRNINNIRYADDTVLLADTEERLQELIDRLDEEGRAIGLKINIGKTAVMGLTKKTEQLRVEAHVNGEAVRQVSFFRYLGSLISEDGRCDAEIKSRIAMAKGNFGKMRRILTNLSLGMNIRLKLLKCYVWSTLLYGLEHQWSNEEEAAEMWSNEEEAAEMFIRRMLRRTNEEVLGMAGMERVLMATIRRRQLGYLGHAIRADGLEKSVLLGFIEGRRARRRQRI